MQEKKGTSNERRKVRGRTGKYERRRRDRESWWLFRREMEKKEIATREGGGKDNR